VGWRSTFRWWVMGMVPALWYRRPGGWSLMNRLSLSAHHLLTLNSSSLAVFCGDGKIRMIAEDYGRRGNERRLAKNRDMDNILARHAPKNNGEIISIWRACRYQQRWAWRFYVLLRICTFLLRIFCTAVFAHSTCAGEPVMVGVSSMVECNRTAGGERRAGSGWTTNVGGNE